MDWHQGGDEKQAQSHWPSTSETRAGGQSGPQETFLALIRKQSELNAANLSLQILRCLKPMHALVLIWNFFNLLVANTQKGKLLLVKIFVQSEGVMSTSVRKYSEVFLP